MGDGGVGGVLFGAFGLVGDLLELVAVERAEFGEFLMHGVIGGFALGRVARMRLNLSQPAGLSGIRQVIPGNQFWIVPGAAGVMDGGDQVGNFAVIFNKIIEERQVQGGGGGGDGGRGYAEPVFYPAFHGPVVVGSSGAVDEEVAHAETDEGGHEEGAGHKAPGIPTP